MHIKLSNYNVRFEVVNIPSTVPVYSYVSNFVEKETFLKTLACISKMYIFRKYECVCNL